jgi:hypothetical protein
MSIVCETSFVLRQRHLLGRAGYCFVEIIGLLGLAEAFVNLSPLIEDKRVAARVQPRAERRSFFPVMSARIKRPLLQVHRASI